MKRLLLLSVLALAACSNEEPKETSEPATEETAEPVKEEAVETKEVVKPEDSGTVEEGGYIKYRGAQWSGEAEGLSVNVNSVSIAEDLKTPFPDYPDVHGIPAVLIWVTLENTSDTAVTADFLQSTIVTDNGTEYEVDTFFSDWTEEEVRPGTNKEGDIIFPLKAGTDLRSIKALTFYFDVKGQSDPVEVKADLQLQ